MKILQEMLINLRFSSPFFFSFAIPLFLLVFWSSRRKKSAGSIVLSENALLQEHRIGLHRGARYARIALLAALCILLGALWAGPRLWNLQRASHGTRNEVSQQFLYLLDLSGSMSDVIGHAQDGTPISKYEAVRQAFYAFVRARPQARIGLILFSDKAFVAAYPTHDTPFLSRAILEENIVDPHPQQIPPYVPKIYFSQLVRFSQGTEIALALQEASLVLQQEAAPVNARAVVLVTDLEDDPTGVLRTIAQLRQQEAVVYVVGIEMPPSMARAVLQVFTGDPGVELFSTHTPQELEDAFMAISKREHPVVFSSAEAPSVMPIDLFPFIGLTLFILFVGALVLSETAFLFIVSPRSSSKRWGIVRKFFSKEDRR